jgi:threonine aldolase
VRQDTLKIIDLRSDTLTQPTDEMRQAMFEAEVGDDVYSEDPTINKLEKIAAERMGKEAALFTTSGTQSNLLAVLTNTHRGDEIIVGSESHIFWYEVGGAAAIGGVVLRTLPNDKSGRLNPDDIEKAIRTENIHFPKTTLLCLENTHNRCGGTILSADYTAQVCDLAHTHGLKVHLDGARIFNAAVALKIPARRLAEKADSVSFCLSKGLSAPVGSLLCGNQELIERARKYRKMLGGGMRQAGILAAAGIVALETMVDRLAEDHTNARRLARGLASIRRLALTQDEISTNIVMFELSPKISIQAFNLELIQAGVKLSPMGGTLFRATTHRMILSADVDEAITRIQAICRKLNSQKTLLV